MDAAEAHRFPCQNKQLGLKTKSEKEGLIQVQEQKQSA